LTYSPGREKKKKKYEIEKRRFKTFKKRKKPVYLKILAKITFSVTTFVYKSMGS